MPALADIVLTPAHADAFIAGCEQLAEARITGLGGLRGTAAKAAFGVLRAARPDLLPRTMRALAPEYLNALEPLYRDFVAAGGGDFGGYLKRHGEAAAQALLAATDARAARVKNPAVKSVYARLRHGAEREVDAALPQFAELLARQLRAAA